MVRTQIFLTKDESRLLERESQQRKIPKSKVIREAVDEYLGIQSIDKEKIIKAFEDSLGSCKDCDLKREIVKARKFW